MKTRKVGVIGLGLMSEQRGEGKEGQAMSGALGSSDQ